MDGRERHRWCCQLWSQFLDLQHSCRSGWARGSPKRLEVFMHEHAPPKRGKGRKRAQSSGLPSLNQNISPLSTSPEQFACPESCREVVLLKQPIACCSGTQACRQQG